MDLGSLVSSQLHKPHTTHYCWIRKILNCVIGSSSVAYSCDFSVLQMHEHQHLATNVKCGVHVLRKALLIRHCSTWRQFEMTWIGNTKERQSLNFEIYFGMADLRYQWLLIIHLMEWTVPSLNQNIIAMSMPRIGTVFVRMHDSFDFLKSMYRQFASFPAYANHVSHSVLAN